MARPFALCRRALLGALLAGAAGAFSPGTGGWAPPRRHHPARPLSLLRAQHPELSEDGSCTLWRQRTQVDLGHSQRLHSTFRTDGTTWSGPVPRARSPFGGAVPRGPEWGADGSSAALPPLDPASKAVMGTLVWALKGGLDLLYQGRADFARFFVLETVARVPYFAYISVLHLYESLGRHRRAAWMKVHYAEADNELHHLLIMEALGGNADFFDRWLAQHAALAYYWACVVLYLLHPRAAYYIMQLIEDHAYKTYSAYVKCNAAWLKTQPAPAIAKQYYESEDLYLFDSFHTAIPETAGACLCACA
jgi:ubiquinol oxidase